MKKIIKKKGKKSGKKPYEGTKWEIVKPTGENLLNIKSEIHHLNKKKINLLA